MSDLPDETIAAITAEMKHVHPEMFDEHGQLVYRRVSEALIKHFGGRRYIGKEDIEELDRSGPLSRCHLTVPADDSGGLHYCYEARSHESQHRCPCGYVWEPDQDRLALQVLCNGCGFSAGIVLPIPESEVADARRHIEAGDVMPYFVPLRAALQAANWSSIPAEATGSVVKADLDGVVTEARNVPMPGASLDYCPSCTEKARRS